MRPLSVHLPRATSDSSLSLHGAVGDLSRLPLHRTPCHPLHAHKRCSSVPSESSHDRHLLSQRQHVPYCVVCVHASRVSHTIACTLCHSSICHCSTASQLTSPTRLFQLLNVMLLRRSAPKPRHRSLKQHLALLSLSVAVDVNVFRSAWSLEIRVS